MIYNIYWTLAARNYTCVVGASYINSIKRDPKGLDLPAYQPYKKMVESGLDLENLPKRGSLELLAEVIKESKEDSFVFVLVNNQLSVFDNWIKTFNLSEHIMFRMHRPVTNNPYPGNGRNLTLVVMMGKEHAYHDMLKANEKVNHEY